MKNPPFAITNTIIDLVAEIAELMGKLTSIHQLSANPTLRRANRIRTIHGSLAIEQNTLSLEQVTAVINGKHVLAPPKDIAEVKNAYEIYERLDELDPYNMDDLLAAHGIMTRGLVEESGYFRSRPVAVVDQQGNILHFGTLPDYVPGLTKDLLEWTMNSELHMLIRSCVFHYELEQIHPFADGNGRIGRLLMFKECLRHEITPFILDDKRRTEYLKGIREWDMDKSTLFTPCLEVQSRFQAQIDLQKLQEYAQRYKPADYKED